MERGDNVVLGNMCENLPHEMVPITKFSAFISWTKHDGPSPHEGLIYFFQRHVG